MTTNCSLCKTALNVNRVHYNGKDYCPKCMDQIDDIYLQNARQHILDVRSGKTITHDS